MTQDLQDKAIKIKGRDYVQVKDRILYLAEEVKEYSINTDYTYYPERKLWVVKATLTLWRDSESASFSQQSYTGLAQEIESDNYKDVNNTSALENAETSAVGRACAMAGIGVIDSIASTDELQKADNRLPVAKKFMPKTLSPKMQTVYDNIAKVAPDSKLANITF